MATSGSFTTNTATYSGVGGAFVFDWWVNSKDIKNNRTSIGWKVTMKTTPRGTGYHRTVDKGSYVTINGVKHSVGATAEKKDTAEVLSGTDVIPHNDDGTKTFTVYMEGSLGNVDYGGYVKEIYGTKNFTLDAIPRDPILNVKVNNAIKTGKVKVMVNNTIKKATHIYTMVNNTLKELPKG